MNLVDLVNKNYMSKNVESFDTFKSGDTINVSVRIKEGRNLGFKNSKVLLSQLKVVLKLSMVTLE